MTKHWESTINRPLTCPKDGVHLNQESPVMLNFNRERLKRLPQRAGTVWQGGWHELKDLKVGDEDPATVFSLGIWTCTDTEVVGPGRDMLHTREAATPAKLMDLLVSFATEPNMAGYRPETIEVADGELAAWLRQELDGTEIQVRQAATLPAWEMAVGDFESFLSKGPGGTDSISLLAAPDVTWDQLIRFGEAAAEFYTAARWHEFADQDLFRVVSPQGGPGLGCAVILGWAGIEFGLGFYDSIEEYDRLQSSNDPETFHEQETPLWLLSFNDRTEKGYRDLFWEWSKQGLPLAGESAYPLLLCRDSDGTPRTANPGELEYLTGLLLALARTETADAEQGRWTVTVPLGGREVDYVLELPYVLSPLGLKDIIRWNIPPDMRSHENFFEAIGTMMGNAMHDDPAAAEKEYNELFQGRNMDEIIAEADLPQTPARQANNYCFEAYDTVGFRKQILARQALACDPLCIRAWNLLGEEISDPVRRLEFYRQAVAAAHKQIDLEAEHEEWGDLRGKPEYRPALRALASASAAAENLELVDEALQYAVEYLNYAPSDPAELRHFAVGHLLAAGRTADADHIVAQWNPEYLEPTADRRDLDPETFMDLGGDRLYVAAANLLIAAQSGLEAKELNRMRQELRRQNRYILPFLDKGKKPPTSAVRNLTLGGGAVALVVGTSLAAAWDKWGRVP